MCYSAQIWADYRRYVRQFGAELDIGAFMNLFWRRTTDPRVKIPKAMEAAFAAAETDGERRIAEAIAAHTAAQVAKCEQNLFSQRKRLADAERLLQVKLTKAATESRRIATDKIERGRERLADLRRTDVLERDARIFPGQYAPVLVMQEGVRTILPMRYQCRPAGKPAIYDTKYPGTYNARRDNLRGFWKDLFGFSHGIIVVNAFFENVPRHKVEGRELAEGEAPENRVLEFRPRPTQDMLVACLWSRWTAPGEPDLLSFAAITDEPPAEVAAAGHDRCIVPIRADNVDAWLNPRGSTLDALDAILEDRDRPFYEYRLAVERSARGALDPHRRVRRRPASGCCDPGSEDAAAHVERQLAEPAFPADRAFVEPLGAGRHPPGTDQRVAFGADRRGHAGDLYLDLFGRRGAGEGDDHAGSCGDGRSVRRTLHLGNRSSAFAHRMAHFGGSRACRPAHGDRRPAVDRNAASSAGHTSTRGVRCVALSSRSRSVRRRAAHPARPSVDVWTDKTVGRATRPAGEGGNAPGQTPACSVRVGSPLGQQPGAADPGRSLVEGPQWLFASLSGQRHVQAIGKVRRALPEQMQRDLQGLLGLEAQLGGRKET